MKANELIKKIKYSAKDKSAEILITLGICSGITSTILAVKATPKALMLLEKEKSERRLHNEDDTLSKIEILKLGWKPYVPAIISGVTGVACIIGAHTENKRRNAALATAYKLTETAFHEYKDAVIEEIGDKKEEIIKHRVSENKLKKDPVEKKEVIITGNGKVLCYDSISGRYFESDQESIRAAVNKLNSQLFTQDYISLNEFYFELKLDSTSVGDSLGWNSAYGLVSVDFDTQLSSDGRPCLVINYDTPPRYDYDKMI